MIKKLAVIFAKAFKVQLQFQMQKKTDLEKPDCTNEYKYIYSRKIKVNKYNTKITVTKIT